MTRPRLEETGRGLTVCFNERYLYSRYNPANRAERIAAAVPVVNRCIYFVPSPLLGYGLLQLAKRIPEDSIILTVEQSQELMSLCSEFLLKEINEKKTDNSRIVNVRLSNKVSLHELLNSLGPWNFRRVQRVDLTGGASLNTDLYDELALFLMKDLSSYWQNRHALGRLGREWIRHIFANLSEISRGKTVFKDINSLKIDRIPVVIGAGPSLEASLDFINEYRKELWILAVDTALPALRARGIQPDAAAVLDTQAWNLLDFHDSAESCIPVIADLTSYPPCLTRTGGICYLFSSDFAELSFLKRLKESGLRNFSIPPLGSVGLAAIELIDRISTGPVFLTGLDFSYSPGKSHARDSSFHRWEMSCRNRLNPHPGWEASIKRPRLSAVDAYGKSINTDAVLQGYAALLKDRYAENKRFHILEPGGLDLDIPLISLDDAGNLIKSNPGEPSMDSNKVSDENAEGLRICADSFIKEEYEILGKVISAWDAYAGGNGKAGDVRESLEGLDEVFADFPDEPPLPNGDDSFLVRGVIRVRQLQRYIERIGS